jgi:predicted transcriptional regulator
LTAQTQIQTRFTIDSKVAQLKIKNSLRVKASAKRERLEIIAEILLFCEQKQLKTAIMYSNNLNYLQLQNCLNDLMGLGMLTRDGRTYMTTEKGHRFLELFAELGDILGGSKNLDALPGPPRFS